MAGTECAEGLASQPPIIRNLASQSWQLSHMQEN